MKLSFEKDHLMNGINIVLKAVPSKTTMPILECILIDAVSDEIKLTGNDMELGIETKVEGTILERGKIALDAKLFSDIIRKLSGENSTITIESDEKYNTTITCDKAIFQIQGKDGDEFSYIPHIERDKFITLSQFTLKEIIRQTIFSISPNDSNKMMTGELMEVTGNENPFYEYFDELLEICHEYDVTISLGDSCRPGCLYDSNDATETAEMIELGKLCKRAWAAGVQVMVEGPGHMALDEIAANMKLQKRLCHNAPFYVLGPLVTDIGVGYDHITAAIGGAISASSGADFLCYVTPAEHLCLPNAQDVLDGLMATKIAAHAADIAKKVPHARDMDDKMGQARRKLDWDAMWECALDPVTGKKRYEESPAATEGTCTMCGKMCAVRTVNKVFEGTTIDLGMED